MPLVCSIFWFTYHLYQQTIVLFTDITIAIWWAVAAAIRL